MVNHPLENLLASSTVAHVNRFLRENQLSGSLPNISSALAHSSPEFKLAHMASTPHLDLQVQLSPQRQGSANNNNAYKNMLKYMPNESFQGEISSINGVSVPNTFKHKSHPNARTKNRIGLSAPPEEQLLLNESLQPMKTSTVKGVSLSNENSHVETTPSWMPPGLDQKWDDPSDQPSQDHHSSGSVRIRPSNPDVNLDFLNSETNTFVHNAPTSDALPVSTPIWKRISQDYQSKALRPLQSIFQSVDDSSEREAKEIAKSVHHSKTADSALTLFSTASTPAATRESDMHLTQQQIHQLEDMLEKAKDKPDDYQMKGSPLKLFGSEYDTFTKAVLTKFVENVRSNASSIQRQQLPVPLQLSAPKLNIKNFTKFGDYTDQDFKKNANNLFANIQKNAQNGSNVFSRPPNESLSFHKSLTENQTTATSTPKAYKTHELDELASINEYSPYSTDFDESSSAADINEKPESLIGDHHEYTSIERSFLTKKEPDSLDDGQIPDNASSYTFDDMTDLEEADIDVRRFSDTSSDMNGKTKHELALNRSTSTPFAKSPFGESPPNLDNSLSSVKQYWGVHKPNSQSEESSSDRYDLTDPNINQSSQLIKWKRPSQLNLSKLVGRKVLRDSSASNIIKGTVKPGNYPEKYGNMVFDVENHKWVSNGEGLDLMGSWDSIEDLISEGSEQRPKPSQREVSILKLTNGPPRDKNLEVSFQVPDSTTESLQLKGNYNVTALSDLGNLTFTQSNKRLISLITGSTDESLWEKVSFIDLANKNLERVEGLDDYLPSIRKMNLANNHLEFIDGLPPGILELNLSQNNVGNITSFKKFRDLQVLDASFNVFTSLSCLSFNLHLTKLDLSNNKVKKLEGLEHMNNLMSLDLSANDLAGHMNFNKFNFSNLQILSLAENKIELVTGLECLPNLRVLNLNDNRLEGISCLLNHSHLKKLLLKFNRLKKLSVEPYPFLRILRIDGNSLDSISDLKLLKFLTELSAKCQDKPIITEQILLEAGDIVTLDLSGNYVLSSLLSGPLSNDVFANLNLLNLSAVGLTSIPESFGDAFENVRELNLNFNKLTSLEGLEKLRRLKKVTAISNNMSKMEMILTSLSNSRKTLKVLDLRLNTLNFDFYPYVFNPHELEIANASNIKSFDSSPIPLEAFDDIENFSIHYNTLVKSREEWEERDADFFARMRAEGNYNRINERLSYESILINFLPKLKDLDGSRVSLERRSQMERRIHRD